MAPIDFDGFDALTFDCYGTLIDWESGLLTAFRTILGPRGVAVDDLDLVSARHGSGADAARHVAGADDRDLHRSPPSWSRIESYRCRAAMISWMCASAHSRIARSGSHRVSPSRVSEYSTLGGISA